MRFASLGGSNAAKYAQAGKAVADSAAKVFDVQRKTGPRYDELSEVAMKTRTAEKIAAIETAADVTREGINQLKNKTEMRHTIGVYENAKNQAKKGRKAGAIAALGRLGAAAYLSTRKDDREIPTNSKEKNALLKQSIEQQREILERMSKNDQEGIAAGDALIDSNSNRTSSTSTGNDSGKAVVGGSDTSPVGTQVDGTTGWGKLSRVLRTGEGTLGEAGYTTMFTGARFNDTSRHPRQINRSGRLASDAAGAYQFLSTTWDGAKNALGLKDFSPASQEKAGRYLTEKRGVNPDAIYKTKAELGRALDRLAPEWASMPTLATGTSYHGQGGISLDRAWEIYNSN